MPARLSSRHPLRWLFLAGVATGVFAIPISALAFGLSNDDYIYLMSQDVERTTAPIPELSPKEQARLHTLINDPLTANDPAARNKNVNEALAEFLGHQLWEQVHPGQLWDAPRR